MVETDGGLDLLATLELDGQSGAHALACQGDELCMAVGSTGGSPSWSVFRVTTSDQLESCAP